MTRQGERGAALGMVVMIALATAIGAYTILIASMNQAQQGVGNANRMRARYAAEAGLVWAQQQLWGTPTLSFTSSSPDITIGGRGIEITVSPVCVATPCPPQTLQARVSY